MNNITEKQRNSVTFSKSLLIVLIFITLLFNPSMKGYGQGYETFPAGSFIVNMGVLPQTVGNALKPYGMVYALVINYGIPVRWIIDTNKVKDGIDFSYAGIDYRGGPFIIPAIYRNLTVDSVIASWQTLGGVVGVTTTSPITVPVYKTLTVSSVPRWTLDKQSGSIVAQYFVNAGIPATAHGGSSSSGWKNPADLNKCDDVFAMPHADPAWATHSNLLAWNRDHKGSIWTACHSGSALELMFNPANRAEQTNFLSLKTGDALGSGPWASPNNSLIIWGSHGNGTPPYQYFRPGDPVMQFMGIMDAAMLNGSEQIYIPVQQLSAGWRPSTIIGMLDPDHPQAHLYTSTNDIRYAASPLIYGYGFGDTTRGMVMYEAGHSHNKALLAPNIAAQRAFFNFSFLAAKEKEPDPAVTLQISNIYSGTNNNLSFTLQGNRNISEFSTILWESTCGGSFAPNNTTNTVFTAPVVSSNTNCIITITLTDSCNRIYKSSTGIVIECNLAITSQVVNPCFTTPTGGSIVVNVSQASGPYNYTWTRTGGGNGSGQGAGSPFSIQNLSAGSYSVTVTSSGGNGCSGSFTTTLTLSPEIVVALSPSPAICNGTATGSISTAVTGGIPGYTYSWSGPNGYTSTVQNPSGLAAGTYNLTVTDSKGCTANASAIVTQPDALLITPTITPVSCFGLNNGQISLAVSGGTSPYTYLWSDGNGNQNRTGLAPASYSVTVTDANSCVITSSNISVTQPSAALSVALDSKTDVACNGQSNGAINITASGGTAGYTYSWAGSGGYTSTSEDISGLAAGNYSGTVTDSRFCTAILQVTIIQPLAISIATSKTDPTCPPDAQQNSSDGAINITVTGGSGTYNNYSWTGPNGFTANTQNISGLIAGTYMVTVIDSNGCQQTASVTLNYLNPNPVKPGVIVH
jgi:hypothetical protein